MRVPTSTPTWRRSSYSYPEGNCVEASVVGQFRGVRDSKNPGQGHLTVSAAVFARFLGGIKGS
ncbi:DUF397 domain-containing protein [Actinocorallia sp. A-T 12471]|uniref:DUF397 domain-containing protein n=1 Tax=Actinocorallia sp. A-T 12471 TaxID=3089813 RepID=UPI0029D0D8A3|nr:DUF397 domain-containing protein [Actinocorallia sp. A-T 12471]MDX6744595.1 DUF397 domain-containing protein [Actinocorallia sp. A-T 12471]